MRITDFLSEDLVWTGLEPKDKADACAMMVDRLIEAGRIPSSRRDILLDKLMERETLASTGIGGGVAIPHASGENIEKMLVAVAVAPGGVDFDAIDDQPARLFFMIIGSERQPRTHLQLLAMIVRACKTRDLVEKLIKSSSPGEAYRLIEQFDRG
ncbi:MAG: PTS sugar transporter subunit IIA [Candidatus Nitrospinota bacterium M3_3B_026]